MRQILTKHCVPIDLQALRALATLKIIAQTDVKCSLAELFSSSADDRIKEADFMDFLFKYEVDLMATTWFQDVDFSQQKAEGKRGFRWGKRRS